MNFKTASLLLFFVLFCNLSLPAQSILSPKEFQLLLVKADQATRHYTETFKNLSAVESKVFEVFDKTGMVKETRRIKSNFIVYQYSNNDSVNEFRNVIEFNGQAVKRSEKEIKEMFEKLARADSNIKESYLLKKEALRFDGNNSAWGMTLWQESPFGKLQPFFEFKLAGKENFNGHEVYVIEYRQTKPTLLLKFNPKKKDWQTEPNGTEYITSVSAALRPENARQEGKIWVDAKTAQIWRNELKIYIQPARLTKRVLALEQTYEYQPGKFDILIPKNFSYTFYKISGTNDQTISVTKDRTMLFEYSDFKEFQTGTKDFQITDN